MRANDWQSMGRAEKFRDLFGIDGHPADPRMIPRLMRFGGFDPEDVYAVESACSLSPQKFVLCYSSSDLAEASEALKELSEEIQNIAPIVADMREARGLEAIRIESGKDRASLLKLMVEESGRESLTENRMMDAGFPLADCLMVGYMERCCRKAFLRMAWDQDSSAAKRAAESIADATGLDINELISFMRDLRGDEPEETEPEARPDPGLKFKKIRVSEAAVTGYEGSEKCVIIPETVSIGGKDLRVTSISDNAFARNRELEMVKMSEGVVTIGKYAFFGCYSLCETELPPTLRAIGDGAFSRCGSLKEIRLPSSLESIGSQSFLGAPIEKAFIPGSVMHIGPHAFGPGTKLSGKKLRSDAALPDLQRLLCASRRDLPVLRILQIGDNVVDHHDLPPIRGFAHERISDFVPVGEGSEGVSRLVGLRLSG